MHGIMEERVVECRNALTVASGEQCIPIDANTEVCGTRSVDKSTTVSSSVMYCRIKEILLGPKSIRSGQGLHTSATTRVFIILASALVTRETSTHELSRRKVQRTRALRLTPPAGADIN